MAGKGRHAVGTRRAGWGTAQGPPRGLAQREEAVRGRPRDFAAGALGPARGLWARVGALAGTSVSKTFPSLLLRPARDFPACLTAAGPRGHQLVLVRRMRVVSSVSQNPFSFSSF